jgi:hypothetical protein
MSEFFGPTWRNIVVASTLTISLSLIYRHFRLNTNLISVPKFCAVSCYVDTSLPVYKLCIRGTELYQVFGVGKLAE